MPFISGNFYLNSEQQKINATYFNTLMKTMWPQITTNAIAGMLGNAQSESSVNPGIWQNLTMNMNAGYGFFQWTPAKNYINWCNANGYDPGNMNSVFLRLDYELENHLQYYPTRNYPLTFSEFIVSEASPELLAETWLYNYERPEVMPQPIRSKYARNWYNYLTGQYPEPEPQPPIPPEPVPNQNRFWWIYYIKRR